MSKRPLGGGRDGLVALVPIIAIVILLLLRKLMNSGRPFGEKQPRF